MNWWVLERRIHSSWIVAVLSVAFLVGVVLAGKINPDIFSSVNWLASGIIISIIVFWRRYIYLLPLIFIAGVLIGLWRGSLQGENLQNTKQIIGHSVTIRGTVKEDVDTDSKGQLTLRLNDVSIGGYQVDGMFWVTTGSSADIKRSDIVTVKGLAVDGFGSFVVSMYGVELLKIERPEPGDTARVVRDWFAERIRDAIPDPQASLGIGFLVGQKRALPAELVVALQVAGLTHVVVASGYNLTILVRLARRLFEKISKYLSALSATAMIVAFIAVTGMSPSMSRAGLVAGLSLAAWYYGRKFHPLVLLPLAAAITIAINPSYIWGDLGWQLSFTAFAGVMILAPLLEKYFFADKKENMIRRIFIETSSAFIMTAPVLIYTFGQVSNVAIIANILILAFIPLAMLLSFIAGICAAILPAVATFIAMPATWLLTYMTTITQYLSNLPWAMREVSLSLWGVMLCYLVIIGINIYLWRATKYNLRDSNIVE